MSADSPLILLIEDEAPMRKFLRVLLTGDGYRYAEATTGEEGLQQAALEQPALILLDLGLPDMDGIEVTRRLREWTQTPIIVLSARELEKDKVEALDLGADDYLTKPFGSRELLARVRVALRSQQTSEETESTRLGFADIEIDLAGRNVLRAGERLELTPLEFGVLTTLVQNAGKVLTHRQILKSVWGDAYASRSHYVRVYITRLRQKLEPNPSRPIYIRTETGVGYRLAADVEHL